MEKNDVDVLNNCIIKTVEDDEKVADLLESEFELKEENYPEIYSTFSEFLYDYKEKKVGESDDEWLIKKFKKYEDLWNNNQKELENDAKNIVETINDFYKAKQELDEHCACGREKESWLEKKIEQGAKAAGTLGVMQYGAVLDTVLDKTNAAMESTIRCLDGHINRNPNLDGFIAEQHHVDTFNLDAAAKESGFYGETLKSTNKNSVDIVIKDSGGNIVRKYQSKYYDDSNATGAAFKGRYKFQRKLVPEGQAKDIPNANEKIEILARNKGSEKIESTPLSKEDAKTIQMNAQEKGHIPEYDWYNFRTKDLARVIGKKVALAAAFAIAFQGARILGRRITNKITGKTNNSISQDMQEFVISSLKTGASVGVVVAATGAMTIVIKRGLLGSALKKTPAGIIASIVCLGMENIKILHKFGKGEITGKQALDQSAKNTISLIGGLAVSAKGAAMGARLGMCLGPVGAAIGGIVGGILLHTAGSKIMEKVYEGGKKIVKAVCEVAKKTVSSAKQVGKIIGDIIKRELSSPIPFL